MEDKLRLDSRKVLAYDIDDVLVDTLPTFIYYYNHNNRTNFKISDFFNDNPWDVTLGVSREKSIQEFYKFMFLNGINLPPIPYSQETIRILSNKYKIVAVSNRAFDFKSITDISMNNNFDGLISKVFLANNYSMNNSPSSSKPKLLSDVSARYFVEDRFGDALNCAESGIKVFLLDKPWNCHDSIPRSLDITRVQTHLDILHSLSGL